MTLRCTTECDGVGHVSCDSLLGKLDKFIDRYNLVVLSILCTPIDLCDYRVPRRRATNDTN